MAVPALCSPAMLATISPPAVLDLVLSINPPVSIAAGWALMVAAMMTPLLTSPVRHVHQRSFARRRARAVVLFVTGYGAVWMAAGAVLLALALTVRLVSVEPALPLALAAAVAAVWQCSPLKQRCLNRCHAQADLAAFGAAADRDALTFGLAHGAWCVGACWALMLLPLLLSSGHGAAMAAVALWLLAERLETPMPAGWRLRAPVTAVRLALAQVRMGLQRS